MDSPERLEGVQAPADQNEALEGKPSQGYSPETVSEGSPFFKYLCGLSPIKPARSVHVVQTYTELSLPPPPAVFSSPPRLHRGGGRVRRGLVGGRAVSTQVKVEAAGHGWSVDKETYPNCSSEHALNPCEGGLSSSINVASDYNPQVATSRQKLEVEKAGDGACDETSRKLEYTEVEDYLADPAESGMYTGTSSQTIAKSVSMLRCSHTCKDASSQEHECQPGDEKDMLILASEVHFSQEYPEMTCRFGLRETSEDQSARDQDVPHACESLGHENQDNLMFKLSSGDGNENGSGNSVPEGAIELYQETPAMVYLLMGNGEAEDGILSEDSSSCDPTDTKHQTVEFSANVKLENSSIHESCDDAAISSKALEDEILRSLQGSEMGSQLESRKNVSEVSTHGQRGVRRRCLDFDISGSRRKSAGPSMSRRSLGGLRPKTMPGSSVMTSSIPSSVLCERAAATSDATNSAPSNAFRQDYELNLDIREKPSLCDIKSLSSDCVPHSQSHCLFQRGDRCTGVEENVNEPPRTLRDYSIPQVSVGVPSGIGLHLNSLTGSISFSPTSRDFKSSTVLGSATKGAVTSLVGVNGISCSSKENRCQVFGKNITGLSSGSKNYSLGSTSSSFGSGVVISLMERSQMSHQEIISGPDTARGLLQTTSLYSLSVSSRQSLDGRHSSGNAFDKSCNPLGSKRSLHQEVVQQSHPDFSEEYENQRSPKRRRKSPSGNGEKSGEGCKRCNCKKSKCLKLYCECFAAGTYCVGSCTCHDCFNKPEHEDIVLSTRQSIEQRNPLAFAPKIVQAADASPKRGQDENMDTPASARHKRGCNCKKSMCLKKYCECYQAGVGCSLGCRCEGCRNVHGQKEAADGTEDREMPDILEIMSQGDDLNLTTQDCQGSGGKVDQPRGIGKDLSPITPSFQYTGQGRSLGRMRSAGKKHCSPTISQPSTKPPKSPNCSANLSGAFQLTSVPTQKVPEQCRVGSPPFSTPKLSRIGQLSPRWDGLGDICTLTPLPQAPLRPTPASISTLDRVGVSPFNPQNMETISSYQGSRPDSGDFLEDSPPVFSQSLNHSPPGRISDDVQSTYNNPTPSTPCPSSPQLSVQDKLKGAPAEDDETPDFLKYSEELCSPLRITKNGSPKQKRVSPPHIGGAREKAKEGRTVLNSPVRAGLRSGRKFILQALPSLPPLMPSGSSTVKSQVAHHLKQV